MFEYIVFGCGLLIVLGVVLLFVFRKKHLPSDVFARYADRIDQTRGLEPAHAIMESHKIFVLALKNLGGKNLPAARVIARHQKRFPNVRRIWDIHRLRNQLAHEIDIKVTEKESENAREVFVRALESITKNKKYHKKFLDNTY